MVNNKLIAQESTIGTNSEDVEGNSGVYLEAVTRRVMSVHFGAI